MTTIGTTSRPAYVYDADTDTWVPIGVGPHTHDEYIDKTIITAKGDIIVGTATDAVAKLGVGTTGQVLLVNPSTPTGLQWGDPSSVVSSATPPTNTSAIWFNTETGVTYVYYDNFWTSIAGSSGAPIISDTAPVDPVLGTQWFNSSTGKSYLYYSDAWVEVDSNGTSNASTGNVIINGAFDIWQRGTSFTNISNLIYSADRWNNALITTASSLNITRVAGPSADLPNAIRCVQTTSQASVTNYASRQAIERSNVEPLAGKPAVLSFWYRSNKVGVHGARLIGSINTTGGTDLDLPFTVSVANTWQRYSLVFSSFSNVTAFTTAENTVAGIVDIGFRTSTQGFTTLAANDYYELAGVQLEAGTVATPFKRNAPSIQAELAACQRYYIRYFASSTGEVLSPVGGSVTSTIAESSFSLPSRFRSSVSGIDVLNVGWYNFGNAVVYSGGTITSQSGSLDHPTFRYTHGSSIFTAGQSGRFVSSGGSAFLGFSAEL